MKKTYILLLLIALLATDQITIGAEIPYLTGRVNDNASVLSEATRRSLSEKLKDHETRTTNQVVILTVPSLEGESIEDYAYKVFNEWKLGQKDKDNGILIVVVPDERRMRIEVGYGLEGTLPDILAGRIIQNIMAPRFREGDYDTGITEGVIAVVTVLEGADPTTVEGLAETTGSQESMNFADLESPDIPLGMRILLGAFIFGIIGLFTILGIMTPGFGWFMYLFLIPFWAMFPVVIVGTKGALVCFFTYLIVYPVSKILLKNSSWYEKAQSDLRTKGKASIGGFTFTSGGSGSSGSSRSSGGGFSGGGGGASGSW
jgi:uncharacterized protein